ncbi:hypothetical protein DFR31_2685 [Alkalispirillum mobile]|uniref:Uncharacterized protein n=1 Tax=Alkalispirillum mobile TaxID=85925 RepID=A0A498BVJ9_9GAMM|nr:SoxR reducing system RseC family protein [Alkalispirillum mobile]RLK46396.1 hypothetical protein DFR31_2685 [Alkalispirillum mobile]
MSKKQPADPTPDLSAQPRAGEIRPFPTGEALFLAPLPIPLGIRATDPNQFLVHMDDTCVDLDASRHTAQAHQIMIGMPFFIGVIFIALGIPLFTATVGLAYGEPFWEITLEVAMGAVPYGLFGGTLSFLILLHAFFHRMKKTRRYTPVRFHRQRREVATYDPDTGQTLCAPFEQVTAWVATSTGATPYGAMTQYNLGLTFEDSDTGRSHTAMFPASTTGEAMGLWEAIRRYMEYGPGNLERPTKTLSGQPIDPREYLPYDGEHTFEIARHKLHEDLRDGFTSRTFVFFWYLYHLITFWKLPFRLAEWEYHQGRAPIPPDMQAWSQPIPEPEWATPSPALEAATRRAAQALEETPGITMPEMLTTALGDWQPQRRDPNGQGGNPKP